MMPSGRSSLPPRKSFGAQVVLARRTSAVDLAAAAAATSGGTSSRYSENPPRTVNFPTA